MNATPTGHQVIIEIYAAIENPYIARGTTFYLYSPSSSLFSSKSTEAILFQPGKSDY